MNIKVRGTETIGKGKFGKQQYTLCCYILHLNQF